MNEYHKTMLEEPDDDPSNVKLFLHGACHIFALALHKHFSEYNFVMTGESAEWRRTKKGIHVYCRLKKGISIDVVGMANENRALRQLGLDGERYEVSLDDLTNELKEFKGLCLDARFCEEMTQRAERRIEKFFPFYNGDKGGDTDIPQASRVDTDGQGIDRLFD